jgi:DeoR family transcriptional regulator of aga operon
VADSSKIGRVTFARICEIDRVHHLITDTGADPGELAPIIDSGVQVVTV